MRLLEGLCTPCQSVGRSIDTHCLHMVYMLVPLVPGTFARKPADMNCEKEETSSGSCRCETSL